MPLLFPVGESHLQPAATLGLLSGLCSMVDGLLSSIVNFVPKGGQLGILGFYLLFGMISTLGKS